MNKRKLSIAFSIMILFLLVSCKKTGSNTTKSVELTTIAITEKPTKQLNFYDVVKDYEYIELETTPKSLIGKIHKVLLTDNTIFVLDRKTAKSVLMFDRKGHFIRKFGGIGKGVGEYLEPQDIFLNRQDSILTIYCKKSKKLISYKFDGHFVKETKIGLNLDDLIKFHGDTLLGFAQSLYNYIELYVYFLILAI